MPDAYRRQGVGKLLMHAIFETAAALGCSRVEWTTDAGNTAAQAFYAKLGLPAHPSKVFYRVEDTGSGLGSIVRGAGQLTQGWYPARSDEKTEVRPAAGLAVPGRGGRRP